MRSLTVVSALMLIFSVPSFAQPRAGVLDSSWLRGVFGAPVATTGVPDLEVPAAAVSFRNAHLAENGAGRVWLRILDGERAYRAVIRSARGRTVRALNLPAPPSGAGEGWFDFDTAGLAPGRYDFCLESGGGGSSATGQFRVERVSPPGRATVPILVDEPVGRNWTSFPVTLGVPFPRSTLGSAEQARVLDSAGREIPAQIRVASSWNEDGRDVKWLTVRFLADAAASSGGTYHLEYGREVRRGRVSRPVRVTSAADQVVVDTGAIRFVVNRRRASIIDGLTLSGRRVTTGDEAGVYLQNQDRKLFCSAWDPEAAAVTVEEAGPIEAVVRQRGWYAAQDGERLCRYDIRIHAFAGQSYLKILHTWILTADSRRVRFGDISIRLPLAETVARFAFGAEAPSAEGGIAGALTGRERVNLVQEDSDRFTVNAWAGGRRTPLASGRRGAGWVAVWTEGVSILAHLRQLWQQYPAELEVTPGAVAVHFWPEHGFSFQFRERPESYGIHRWPYTDGAFMDLQPKEYFETFLMQDKEKIKGYDLVNALGLSKTQEVWLDFGAARRSAAAVQEQARKFDRPLAARAEAQWLADSQALRPFGVKDEQSSPALERAIRARWDGETYIQDRAHDYGWLHFGDRHSAGVPLGPNAKFGGIHRYWMVTDYRCGMEPWLLWARSGERLYYDWAEVISRHLMDVDIVHWGSRDVRPPRQPGQFYAMSAAHYSVALRSYSSHNDPIAFNLMYYHLTDYRRALDVLMQAGERELDFDLAAGRLGRHHMVTGHNQLDMYRTTWDERHWDQAWKAIGKALDTTIAKPYHDHTYSNEFFADIGEFTGDSRLRAAVLTVADAVCARPLPARLWYPAIFIFGHAYAVSGDPAYIAYGKSSFEPDVLSLNVSGEPERRGRATVVDNIHYTRAMRQIPGFLYYQKQAEAEFGPIERRTPPVLLAEAAPVHLLQDADRPFTILFYLAMRRDTVFAGNLTVTRPDGQVAVREAVSPERLTDGVGCSASGLVTRRMRIAVPADGQTGVYRLDTDIPMDVKGMGGPTWVGGTWAVDCPDLRKVAIQTTRFTFAGGHVFFYVPEGTGSFRVRANVARWRGNAYGAWALLAPDGRQALRVDVQDKDWIEVKPEPADTGGVWGLVTFCRTAVELAGVPGFIFSDPADCFLPELPAATRPD